MVIKKSNTLLNSGATQRRWNGLFHPTRDNYLAASPETALTVSLSTTSESGRQRSNPRGVSSQSDLTSFDFDYSAVQAAFDLLIHVLGYYDVLDSREFPVGLETLMSSRAHVSFPLKKAKRFELANALGTFVSRPTKEPSWLNPNPGVRKSCGSFDALRCISELVNLRVVHNKEDRYGYRSKSTTVTSADTLDKTVEASNDQEKKNHAVKMRKTPHCRGIQRPSMWNVSTPKKQAVKRPLKRQQQPQNDCLIWNENAKTEPSKNPLEEIVFVIDEGRREDARAATVNTPIKRFGHRPYNAPRVAITKVKGCVKGRMYEHSGFTLKGLQQDIREAMEDIETAQNLSNVDESFNWGEQLSDVLDNGCQGYNQDASQGSYQSDVIIDADDATAFPSYRQTNFSIADLLAKTKTRKPPRHTKRFDSQHQNAGRSARNKDVDETLGEFVMISKHEFDADVPKLNFSETEQAITEVDVGSQCSDTDSQSSSFEWLDNPGF